MLNEKEKKMLTDWFEMAISYEGDRFISLNGIAISVHVPENYHVYLKNDLYGERDKYGNFSNER